MYIVPPTRPHRSLIGQPIIGVGSLSSYSTAYTTSSSSSPTSGSSNSSSRSRRTKSSNTYYSSHNDLSPSNASSSRYPPCPPAYENRRLRRRDAFGVGEAAALTTRMMPISTTTLSSRRKAEMPIERIPAVVREARRSRYDNYYHIDEDVDDYYEGRYPREQERDYRYSRRHGENRLRSFSEHARVSGRQELIDLMRYAYDDDDISSWTRYCRTC